MAEIKVILIEDDKTIITKNFVDRLEMGPREYRRDVKICFCRNTNNAGFF